MKKEEVHYADIIYKKNDKTLVKVHHIGNNGEVYYFCYVLDNLETGMKVLGPPYNYKYGNIEEYIPATEKQKYDLEMWLIKNS